MDPSAWDGVEQEGEMPPESNFSHPRMATSTCRCFALPLCPSPLPTATWKTSDGQNWAGKGMLSFASLTLQVWGSQSGSPSRFSQRKAPAGCFAAGLGRRLKGVIACRKGIGNGWSRGGGSALRGAVVFAGPSAFSSLLYYPAGQG